MRFLFVRKINLVDLGVMVSTAHYLDKSDWLGAGLAFVLGLTISVIGEAFYNVK